MWIRLCILFLALFCSLVAEEIKIGILHSLTGTMASSEKPVVNATMIAIDEINKAGGVLGKQLKPILFDGKSDWPTFTLGAEELIVQDKVAVIFGCWTSASRKNVKEVVEKYHNLLFYPVQYEGLEMSPNIVYTGSAPNQQIIPGTMWAYFHLGKRLFLVGSDYVFPRTANAIIKDVAAAMGGEIVGEEYMPLGSDRMEEIVDKIVKAKPDVILNTINGDANIAFFRSLRSHGITPEKIPTLSFSLIESQFAKLDVAMLGDYATWSYFNSIKNPVNAKFLKQFPSDAHVSDPMEAAYFGVHMWAQAVEKAGSFAPEAVLETIKDVIWNAPEGMVYIDSSTQHTWKFVRIGKLRDSNIYDVIWSSDQAIRPLPYPSTREKSAWDQFLTDLYNGYGKKWAR